MSRSVFWEKLEKYLKMSAEIFTQHTKCQAPLVTACRELCFHSVFLIYSIVSLPDVDFGKRIYVLPIDDTVEGFTG